MTTVLPRGLSAELDRALAVFRPLRQRCRQLSKVYETIPRPAGILVRERDIRIFSDFFRIARERVGLPFNPAEVKRLGSANFARRLARLPGAGETDLPVEWAPDQVAADRAAEIMAAAEEYDVATKNIRAAEAKAGDLLDEAFRDVETVISRIEKAPALTIEDLRLKARAAAWCHDGVKVCGDEATTDNRLAWSIVSDILSSLSFEGGRVNAR